MKLVIDRELWLRGEGDGRSYLLRGEDGKMCCLGFYCLKRGYSKEDIFEKRSPDIVEKAVSFLPELLRDNRTVTSVCGDLMIINDEVSRYSEDEREERISGLFASIGVEVEFIN